MHKFQPMLTFALNLLCSSRHTFPGFQVDKPGKINMNGNSGSYKSVKVLPSPSASSEPKIGAIRAEQGVLSKLDVVQPRLNIVSDPRLLPIPTSQSRIVPSKDLSQPPNRYYESRSVNSRAEAKSSSDYRTSGNSPKGVPPQFIGSTFTHLPNAANRPILPAPKVVTTARPYPVLTAAPYSGSPMLSNRTPNGTILGSPGKKFVPDGNVPYLPPDEPLGPDNLTKQLNDTWTACWDKEAGATYYYNVITGEATWLPPDL